MTFNAATFNLKHPEQLKLAIIQLIEAGEWRPDVAEQVYMLAGTYQVPTVVVTEAIRLARLETKHQGEA